MSQAYVGLDAHFKTCAYTIGDGAGQVGSEGTVATTSLALLAWQRSHDLPAGTPVALETGTVSFHVARVLARLGLDPHVIDAHEVRLKAYRPRQKCDRRDARELYEGLRRGLYRSRVYVPDANLSRLRETLSRRRHFVRLMVMQRNAARRLLRAHGLHVAVPRLASEKAWVQLLAALRGDVALHDWLALHAQQWRAARQCVTTLEQSLQEQRLGYATAADLLETIPGFGLIVALTVIAVFGDVRRFVSAKHAASYGGLVPASHDSAERVAHGRITRSGSSELRAMLCEAAHHARHPRHPLHRHFGHLCVRHGAKRAVVAIAHQLCRIAYAVLRDQVAFDPARCRPRQPQLAQAAAH